MSLITKDKYEGLEPELAQALKDGLMIKGWFSDDDIGEVDGSYMYLNDYNLNCDYPFHSNNGSQYKYFKPDTQKEIDWRKAKVKILRGRDWYASQVGAVFCVCGEGKNYYEVIIDYHTDWVIQKEDCQLITE